MIEGFNTWEQEAYKTLFPEGNSALDGETIVYRHAGPAQEITIEKSGDGWLVTAGEGASFGRSLMLLWEAVLERKAVAYDGPSYDVPSYENLGMLVDCSRGAVPAVETVKKLLRILARMGYHSLWLYMEDTFELPDYPYWGYRRGAYTASELKEMDRYAASIGIELAPAIQTLAHVGQALKWPAFSELVDTGDILLIGEEKTYELLDRIFAQMAECFTTRRINIGMDEAHLVGLGEYLHRNGYQDRMEVMLNHFNRVYELAKKHGFAPMMWSDMFFRLACGGEYYDPDAAIDRKVSECLPEDVTLIYWDYYSEEKETYDRMLDKHKQVTDHIAFAGGAWKWSGFNPCNHFSIKLAQTAHESLLSHGIREVLVTAWGDNGAECALFDILPALQYWAELCYGDCGESLRKRRFSLCCEDAWDRFLLLDEPVFTPYNPAPGRMAVNAVKYLFYQDILSGLFDAHVVPDSYERHFAECEEQLGKAAKDCNPKWHYLFTVQEKLCSVLRIKCRIGLDLRSAYEAKDRNTLQDICENRIPALHKAAEEFSRAFRKQWESENKEAGYEIIDLRIGGLLQRINTAKQRIEDYLSDGISSLEELEAPLLPYDGTLHGQGRKSESPDIAGPFWHHTVSGYNMGSI